LLIEPPNLNEENPLDLIKDQDLALLISEDRKQFILRLRVGEEFQTHRGVLKHSDLIGIPWGQQVYSHLETPFYIFRPTMRDILLETKRASQIVFPKEIGYLILRLSISHGSKVIEAGAGSGALTTALAWAVGPTGQVYSYEKREDMLSLARKNIEELSLRDRVTFHLHDIEQGFIETGIPALFLDLPTPERYLKQALQAMSNGGVLGALVPTTNQVAVLVRALKQNPFDLIDVCEILLRFYKPVPERIRPNDRMIAHTGYLIFARSLVE
jgi:tRNA (adenine57-N1/adenine58-N1)-methyltransferase